MLGSYAADMVTSRRLGATLYGSKGQGAVVSVFAP